MQKDNSDKSLKPSTEDYMATAARSVLGLIPFVGSLVAELVGVIIPIQRLDTLAKFTEKLGEKLSKLDQDFVHCLSFCSDFDETTIKINFTCSDTNNF